MSVEDNDDATLEDKGPTLQFTEFTAAMTDHLTNFFTQRVKHDVREDLLAAREHFEEVVAGRREVSAASPLDVAAVHAVTFDGLFVNPEPPPPADDDANSDAATAVTEPAAEPASSEPATPAEGAAVGSPHSAPPSKAEPGAEGDDKAALPPPPPPPVPIAVVPELNWSTFVRRSTAALCQPAREAFNKLRENIDADGSDADAAMEETKAPPSDPSEARTDTVDPPRRRLYFDCRALHAEMLRLRNTIVFPFMLHSASEDQEFPDFEDLFVPVDPEVVGYGPVVPLPVTGDDGDASLDEPPPVPPPPPEPPADEVLPKDMVHVWWVGVNAPQPLLHPRERAWATAKEHVREWVARFFHMVAPLPPPVEAAPPPEEAPPEPDPAGGRRRGYKKKPKAKPRTYLQKVTPVVNLEELYMFSQVITKAATAGPSGTPGFKFWDFIESKLLVELPPDISATEFKREDVIMLIVALLVIANVDVSTIAPATTKLGHVFDLVVHGNGGSAEALINVAYTHQSGLEGVEDVIPEDTKPGKGRGKGDEEEEDGRIVVPANIHTKLLPGVEGTAPLLTKTAWYHLDDPDAGIETTGDVLLAMHNAMDASRVRLVREGRMPPATAVFLAKFSLMFHSDVDSSLRRPPRTAPPPPRADEPVEPARGAPPTAADTMYHTNYDGYDTSPAHGAGTGSYVGSPDSYYQGGYDPPQQYDDGSYGQQYYDHGQYEGYDHGQYGGGGYDDSGY